MAVLSEELFKFATEDFAGQRVLIPELILEHNGIRKIYSKGLHHIDLRATWNWDFKWVKQPLRDILGVKEEAFSRLPGTNVFKCRFEADEPLAYAELLDNDEIMYIPDTKGESDKWRESQDTAVFHISAISRLTLDTPEGTLSVEGASQVEWCSEGVTTAKKSFPWLQTRRWWNIPLLVRISKADVKTASLVVNLPGVFQESIPLEPVHQRSIMSWSAMKGFNLTVTAKYLRQFTMPSHFNSRLVEFTAKLSPDTPFSTFHVQLIGKSGRTWRSRPIILELDNKPAQITVWSNTKSSNVVCTVPQIMAPILHYDFSPLHGDILFCPEAGRTCWGILGASVGPATGRNWGPGADSTTYGWNTCNNTVLDSAPKRVSEGGKWLLDFDGKGMIAVLPHSVIPKNACWELSLDFRPEEVTRRQSIVINGYPPAMNGMINCYLENGTLTFIYGGMTNDFDVHNPAMVSAGEWCSFKLKCENTGIRLAVNGLDSGLRPIDSPTGRFTAVTSLGGMPGAWFKGQIKNLQISQRP